MRKTLFLGAAGLAAALATAAAAGPARAQALFPGDAQALAGNVVGGGAGATISGGGDDLTITYSTTGAGAGGGPLAQAGRLARFKGTDGDGLQVEYSAPVPPAVPGAGTGREAWLVGGGDDAQVVYASPHRRR
jgi:hypothetical protein